MKNETYIISPDICELIISERGYIFAISPDGQQIAFVQSDSLKIMPVDGGAAHGLLSMEGSGIPRAALAWSPDGHSLLFGKGDPEVGMVTLWRISVEGGVPQRLELTMEGLRNLRVHPDGQQITFAAGWLRSEVWVMEPVPSEAQPR